MWISKPCSFLCSCWSTIGSNARILLRPRNPVARRRCPYGSYSSLPSGRVRGKLEEQLGEVVGPGEHGPVSRG